MSAMDPSTSAESCVRRVAESRVTCSDPAKVAAASRPWRLGPLDSLVAYQVPVAVIFVYEAAPASTSASDPGATFEPISIARLRVALSHLLNYYPHLTGRLNVHPDTGVRTIDQLGTGITLYECEVDQALHDFRKDEPYSILDLPGAGNALLAPFDPSFEGVRKQPILTIQHTRFACGSVALGVRCSHVTTDGDGYFRLVGDLARIYRNLDEEQGVLPMGSEPCVKAYLADEETDEDALHEARQYQPSLFTVDDIAAPLIGSGSSESASTEAPPPIIGRELHFSSNQLESMRKAAADPAKPNERVSTFIALCATLYQAIHRARTILEREDPSRYTMVSSDFLSPLNLRAGNRLPGLAPNHFPNALLTHYTTLSPDQLSSSPLHNIASRLREMFTTHAVVGTAAEQTVKWIAAQPNKNQIRLGFRGGPGSFMISQWSRFDLYGEGSAQFEKGWKPVLVSPPFTPISLIDGLAYVLPPHPVDGKEADGVVVYVSLIDPVWAILDRERFLEII